MKLGKIVYINDFLKNKKRLRYRKHRKASLSYNKGTQLQEKILNDIENHKFLIDKHYLFKNLKTKKPKFKYPTILSQYRANMNPISSIYESCQKSIMKYNNRNYIDEWVIDETKRISDDLINALLDDIKSMNNIIQKYKHKSDLFDELQLIYNQLKLYCHYIKVFKIIKTWN